jgi:hypothetical protein
LIRARAPRLHAVLFAKGAPHGDAPAQVHRFAKGRYSHHKALLRIRTKEEHWQEGVKIVLRHVN